MKDISICPNSPNEALMVVGFKYRQTGSGTLQLKLDRMFLEVKPQIGVITYDLLNLEVLT